jgi:hypothetical protein
VCSINEGLHDCLDSLRIVRIPAARKLQEIISKLLEKDRNLPLLGERSKALQMLEELKEISKTRFVPGFFYALVYVGLPEDDQAFARLEKTCQSASIRLAYLDVEPIWDPIRTNPRFAAVINRVVCRHLG